jgi:oligopeptidase B
MTSFPIAAKHPHEINQHGTTRVDNYYWMRDKQDPETLRHLRAESDYLEEMTQHTKPLQEKLFSEMKARIKEDDSTVPAKRGGYFYYKREERGKQYPIFCRKKGSLDAAEEILLDQNELAEGKSFCSVGAFSVSPDGTKLVYSIDYGGREIYTLHIKDLKSGEMYPETIENTSGSAYEHGGAEWANDNKTLFYTTLDDAQRPFKLFRHKLGTDPALDILVFSEEDESYFLFVLKTRDDAYIMTHHYSTTTREMRFLSADHPEESLRVLQPRINGLEYFAAHHNGRFFIVHNDNAN